LDSGRRTCAQSPVLLAGCRDGRLRLFDLRASLEPLLRIAPQERPRPLRAVFTRAKFCRNRVLSADAWFIFSPIRHAQTQRHHSERLSTIGAMQLCSDDIHCAVSTIDGKVRQGTRGPAASRDLLPTTAFTLVGLCYWQLRLFDIRAPFVPVHHYEGHVGGLPMPQLVVDPTDTLLFSGTFLEPLMAVLPVLQHPLTPHAICVCFCVINPQRAPTMHCGAGRSRRAV